MRPFSHDHASGPAAEATYLAGGTTLLDLMKLDVMRPARLADINGLGLDTVALDAQGLRLGALARMAEVAGHADVRREYPVLAQSLALAASQQLRNMASLGGNVLQRTRCPYFRDVAEPACNKRNPGSGCAAKGGVNRLQAVLGTSEACIAAYPGDFAQALVALDAEVSLRGAEGERRIRFAELHVPPGETPERENTLRPGELITGFTVPAGPWARRSLYLKVRDRESYAFALASAAVALQLDGEVVREVRIALGGVATVPWRAREAEEELRGKVLDEASAMRAAEAAFRDARTHGENDFKPELGRRTLVRALLQAKQMEAEMPDGFGSDRQRKDGPAKVTGGARYASDVVLGNVAHAWLVTSSIARGRVTGFDEAAARAVPGVLEIFTHRNMQGVVAEAGFFATGGYLGNSVRPLEGDRVWHHGQIVAMVVADTLEAAREAAHRLRVEYAAETPAAGFDAEGVEVKAASEGGFEDPQLGDADAAFAAAEVKLEARYSTPTQHHNPIELFTTTALWRGDELELHEGSQFVHGLKNGIAKQLGMDPAKVHVVSPFVGGAFGARGSMTQRTALVAEAARRLRRPVKLVPTRAQGFTIATYRAETRQRVQLAASRDGRLQALVHEGWEVTSRPDPYKVGGTATTARIYACPNVRTKVHIVHADRNTPGFMRSPPELPYMFALESAMDELAYALDMDPVQLRRVNDTQREPIKGLPYTSRNLLRCLDEGAKAFGWEKRAKAPGSMRDGDWQVGYGMATSVYPAHIGAATARVTLLPGGQARVQIAAHDVGTGAYTAIGLAAAEGLGLALDQVHVELGDSNLPPAPVAGGSNTTASACNVVMKACEEIRARRAQGQQGAIEVYAENVPEGLPEGAIGKLYQGHMVMTGGLEGARQAMAAFGAVFVEVRVHARTREVRVPRVLGAFAAGRIVSPRQARSQLTGGLIWGIGAALHEATEIDPRSARYMNDNLAEYLVPVNADIRQLDVLLLEEADDQVNPLGIKGIGELGNVGTNAALANAVFHATGVRLRDLPVRIEQLLA